MARATRTEKGLTPRQMREGVPLTLAEASAASGLAINTIRSIEAGAENVRTGLIEDLARIYGRTRMEMLEACERVRGVA